jgi:hypothetical protein
MPVVEVGAYFLVIVGLGALAWRIPITPVRAFLAGFAALLWLLAAFAFFAIVAYERSATGPSDTWNCPISGSSDYAPSHWSWAPLGPVCEYPHGDVGPTAWSIPEALVLVAIPAGAVMAWPRRRPARGALPEAVA